MKVWDQNESGLNPQEEDINWSSLVPCRRVSLGGAGGASREQVQAWLVMMG